MLPRHTYIGAVATTANPAATTKDLSLQIKDCKPTLVITTRGMQEKIDGFNLPTVFLDDASFQNVVNLGATCLKLIGLGVRQSDVACLLYSSGTLGKSKGVVLSHRYFIGICYTGYLNNEQATKETIDEKEWLHTGDLGYFDDSGNLYIVNRIKELMKYKGFQIAPGELEAMLLQHSDLLDAVVILYPDEEAGEVPAENEEKRCINSQVAFYERQRHVSFLQEVPKSTS